MQDSRARNAYFLKKCKAKILTSSMVLTSILPRAVITTPATCARFFSRSVIRCALVAVGEAGGARGGSSRFQTMKRRIRKVGSNVVFSTRLF